MATRLLQYGFEDFSGSWPSPGSTSSPGDGYIFSGGYNTARVTLSWYDHLGSCRVVAGNGTRDAKSGTYYLHHGFCTQSGQTDSYLGNNVSSSVDTDVAIGSNLTYPSGTKNTLTLSTSISTGYTFLRFWFRLTDNWMTSQTKTAGGYILYPGLKFIRFGTTAGYADTRGPIVQLGSGWDYSAEDGWPHVVQYRNGSFISPTTNPPLLYGATTGPNSDGWHCVCVLHRLLNSTNTDPNSEMWVWWDDWNCEGTASFHRADLYHSDLGTGIGGIRLAENWAAQYPSTLMGIDFDDFEVWDGAPTLDELVGTQALANDGSRRYWRIRYRDADGVESAWSSGADYFDMAITASGAMTLSSPTLGGAATKSITATGAVTLGLMVMSGVARTGITCNGALSLGSLTLGGIAEREVTATGAFDLSGLVLAGGGDRAITATGAITISKPTLDGEAWRNGASPLRLPGATYYWRIRYRDAAGAISSYSTGADFFTTGSIRGEIGLGLLQLGGAAVVGRSASGSTTLGEVQLAGVAVRKVTATGSFSLGALTLGGGAARVVTSSGALQLRLLRFTSGVAERVVTSSGTIALGGVHLEGATGQGKTASGGIVLGSPVLTGRTALVATGAISLGSLTFEGQVKGLGAILNVTTRIVTSHTVTTRIVMRETRTNRIEGERE